MSKEFIEWQNFLHRAFVGPDLAELLVRSLARGRRDMERAYIRALKKAIRQAKLRPRSGNLARKKGSIVIRSQQRKGKSILGMNPSFPLTTYRTPRGRGRPGASKRGQYAFVLDSSRGFIDAANEHFRTDPRVGKALGKHVTYVMNQMARGR
ncbi:MAG: hypothetical protein OXG72_10380 [Acidobacteria bacterium]|nr:hypothetical protein [Acidobacteriota bacterium]